MSILVRLRLCVWNSYGAPNHDSSQPARTSCEVTIGRLHSGAMSRFLQDDSHMAVTAWAGMDD